MKKLGVTILLLSILLVGTGDVNAEEISNGSETSITIPQDNEIIYSTWGGAQVEFNKSDGQLLVKKGIISNYTYITSYVDEDEKINKQDVKNIVFEDGVQVPSYGRHLFSSTNNWTKLESIIGNLDTSKVTDMSDMFFNSTISNIDLDSFDTSHVTNMQWMFGSTKVSQLNLKNFDTSNVTNMSAMFYNMPNLTSLDVSSFNTSNVTRMDMMFDTIPTLNSLDVSNFNTSKVTDMSYMFRRDSGIKSLDLTSYDTANVLNMDQMFSLMTNLASLDISNFDTSSTIDTSGIFLQDYNLSNLKLGNEFRFGNSSDLPEIDQKSEVYSGKWIKIDPSDPTSIYDSSKLFMEQYDGLLPGTYTWQKKKLETESHIIVNYQDEQGNALADTITLTGNVGDKYTTDKKKIDGYTFKEILGSPEGIYAETDQTITYVYTKTTPPVIKSSVIVNYQDEQGNALADTITLTGNVGDKYTTDKKKIDGYMFKKILGSPEGIYADTDQTITYVYAKTIPSVTKSSVIVNYQDEQGNVLADSITLTGNVGSTYATEAKTIKGYALDETSLPTNAKGEYKAESQVVIYIYKKTNTSNSNSTHQSENVAPGTSSSTKDSSSEKQFPKTGEAPNSSFYGVLSGMLMVFFAVIVSALKLKKIKY